MLKQTLTWFLYSQRIPYKFVKKFGDELSSIATLTVPSGRLWLMKLSFGDKLYLSNSLDSSQEPGHDKHEKDIEDDHDRKKYKNSISGADLKILHQKNDGHDLEATFQSTQDKGIQFSGIELTSTADEGGPYFLNETQQNTKKIKQETELTMNPPRSVLRRRRDVTIEEKQSAFRAAAMFKPDNPFCRIILRPSYVYKGILLHIPLCFAQRYLNGIDGTITLQVSEGKKWHVRCIYGHGSMKFSKGWAEFVMDNNLDEGDVCVFELINSMEIPCS
ncbi:hypothetical protein CRYUN_Cryun18bG0102500 [Craigia yunnanensis]